MFLSLQELKHKVWGDDPNDYKLLRKCFATLPETAQPSIPHLYQYVRQDTNERVSNILIRILGYLSYQIVQAKLEKNCSALVSLYPDKLQTIFKDFLVILSFPRDKLATDPKFSWISPQDYSNCSWSQDHATTINTPAELLRTGLSLGVLIWPMPRPLSHLLDLNRVPYIRKGLDNLETRCAQMVADIYKYLIPVEDDTPFAFTFPVSEGKNADLGKEERVLELTDAEKALRREECLLRFAAFAGFPNLNSWMDEILLWGKKYKQMERIRSLFKALKLTHLLIDEHAKEILGIISKSESPKAQKEPAVIANIIPVPAEHRQPLPDDQKPLSFQTYLIKKSLNLLNTEFSLSPVAYAQLEKLFKSNEAEGEIERINSLFFVYALNVSSQREYGDFYRLKEMMNASYSSGHSSSFFTHQLKIYQTLFQSFNSTTTQYAKAFLVIFFLRQHFNINFGQTQQALLIDYLSALNVNSTQNIIYGLERLLNRLPLDSLNSLSTLTWESDSPSQFFRHLIWELYVRSHFPSTCWKDLLELHSTLSVEDFKMVRLCVYQWFQLYPTHHCKLDMDEILTFFECQMPERVAQHFPFDKSFAYGSDILNKSIKKESSVYSLLHVTLCFIYWNHYLNFSKQIQETLFTVIHMTPLQHREACVESWLTFGNCLPINTTTGTIQAARLWVLKNAYEAKSKELYIGDTAAYLRNTLLKNWPHSLEDLMNFQVEFLQRVEKLTQGPVPLITYLILLSYCPSLPIESDLISSSTALIDQLQQWKASLSLRLKYFKNLFIPPSWTKQCDVLTQIDAPSLLISANCYSSQLKKKEHVSYLSNYIGHIKSAISTAVLPALPFRENLCEQTEDLFKFAGKTFPSTLQNRVYYYADATMNGNMHAGEWRSISYMIEWKIVEHPVLYIVLLQSFYHLQSREIRLNLEIPTQNLHPKFNSLLETMLVTLGEEIREIQDSKERDQLKKKLEDLENRKKKNTSFDQHDQESLERIQMQLNPETYLNVLTTLQEEFDFCLKFYGSPLTINYQAALKHSSPAEILSLFKFVKELKIQARQAQADLFQQEPNLQASSYTPEWLAGQGQVYRDVKGLSLVPTHVEASSFYRIEDTEWTHELQPLAQRLQTSTEPFEISQLLTLPLAQNVHAPVDLSFVPYLDSDFEPTSEMISDYLQTQNVDFPEPKKLSLYDQLRAPPLREQPKSEAEEHLQNLFLALSHQKALVHMQNYVKAGGTFDAFMHAFSQSPKSSYVLFPLFKSFINHYYPDLKKDRMKEALQICAKLIELDLEGLKEFALETGDLWFAQQLYAQGWNVNQPLEKSGLTPLVKAVQHQQPCLVTWLLLKGANPVLKGNNDLTALEEAQKLKKKGSDDFSTADLKVIKVGYKNSPIITQEDLKDAKKEKEQSKEAAKKVEKMGQNLLHLLNNPDKIKKHFLPIKERLLRINEVTFKLNGHTGITYSCKLLDFVNHANLENFLRWQLLMLKSRYYAAQLREIPQECISTFLGIEERLASPPLQTNYFEDLKLPELLHQTACEPLSPLILHQDPPFKLSLVDAKALYKESPVDIQFASGQTLSVKTDPEYQQLERFIPPQRPPHSCIGASFVNNYPSNYPDGQMNCDMFYVEQDLSFIFSILADGCSSGNKPREAAQRAVAGVVAYLHQSLSHSLYTLKTARELACILVRSLANAHDNILKEKQDAAESGTTTINICFAFKDANQQKHLMTVGVGDSKAFLVFLDENYRVVDVADRQHLNHDIKDPGGRLGPYNGSDGNAEAHHPDLRNLAISCCPLPTNSIVFNMSDGAHDNFDPEILQIPPYTIDNTIEKSKLWTDLKKENLDRYSSLKSTYQAECLGNLVRKAIEAGKQTADEICQEITSFCHQVTESKRKPMEGDSNLNEPYEPGKLDHCSIVAFKG